MYVLFEDLGLLKQKLRKCLCPTVKSECDFTKANGSQTLLHFSIIKVGKYFYFGSSVVKCTITIEIVSGCGSVVGYRRKLCNILSCA